VPPSPGIKAEVRRLRRAECRQLAQEALRQDTAAAVRGLCPAEPEDEEPAPPASS
jgi:phosphoenolpyruvate-protein kinase (PTS system EI component)